RVGSVEHVDVWTKAGLMIRGDMTPGSIHGSVFVTPGRGIAFQRRLAGMAASVHTAGPLLAAPVWLRLVRAGDTVSAFYRQTESQGWQPISVPQTFTSLPHAVQVGLAVTSH